MVDSDTALGHHFLEIPVTQGIGEFPADVQQDDLFLKPMSAKVDCHAVVPRDFHPLLVGLTQRNPQKEALRVRKADNFNLVGDGVTVRLNRNFYSQLLTSSLIHAF